MFSNEQRLGFVQHEGELHAVWKSSAGNKYYSPSLAGVSYAANVGSLEELCNSQFPNNPKSGKRADSRIDFKQLHEVGFHRVVGMSADLDRVELEHWDARQRRFVMRIGSKIELDWSPIPPPSLESGLLQAWQQCIQQVDLLQEFWNEMDEVDNKCRVLDPALPVARSVTRRRLSLFDQQQTPLRALFVELIVSPLVAKSPMCQVVGVPESEKQRWNLVLDEYAWDKHLSICDNLTKAFAELGGVCANPVTNQDMNIASQEAEECGICYVYRLEEGEEGEEQLPDAGCGKCLRPFHHTCVLAYLRSLPTARRSFKLLLGECPYCNETMTVREK
ncbi:hypothetical protein BASA81_001075 [Batrachochytrium salamandrivorans]|nr:hypothetical protein BASA81_001075 [Batrachochytrium salamandrivorans]